MRRTAILAAAAFGSLVASSTYAAFTFTTVPTTTVNGMTRVDVFARNDGAAVGTNIPAGTTKVQAVQYTNETFNTVGTGAQQGFRFRYNSSSGTVDLYNNRGLPTDDGDGGFLANNLSAIFLAPASTDNTYQNVTFTPVVNSSGTAATVQKFTVDNAATSNAPSATALDNGGLGARIASLVVNPGATFTVTGNIAAEQGTAVPFTFTYPSVVTGNNPVVTPAAAIVSFGQVVSNGQAFSVNVNVADLDGGLLTLVAGAASGGSVSGLTITPAGGANSPAVFTVSGTVAYGPNGTLVTIPLTATDSTGGTGSGNIVLTLIPEPASLAALAGAAGLGLIRRRK